MKKNSIAHRSLFSAVMIAVFMETKFCRAASDAVTNFTLPKWESGEKVSLADYAGQIVVLDFFAYWCAPCRRASADVEQGIQKFYAGKNGNPHGTTVRVLSINIEKDNPKQTAEFIRQTGLSFVLNDHGGALLEKFGASGTPFLVILDGTRATKDTPDFRVLYQESGFEGTKKLRKMIDGIKPTKTARAKLDDEQAAIERATGPPVAHKGGVSFDALLADDIQITSTALTYGHKRGGTEWSLNYTYKTYEEDYEPFKQFDFIGTPESLSEDYHGGQLSLRQSLHRSLTLLASGGGYDGFTDYRSVWLANYYRQQFAKFFPNIYEQPAPKGWNVAGGLRWEYQPTTGFIDAGFLYAEDQIAPGYDRDDLGRALIGDKFLYTQSPYLKFENVLTPRLRTLHEFQMTDTSRRELRLAYRGSVNIALSEHWTGRVSGGYTHENPTLRAWHLGATLEFEFAPRWLVSVSGLYYEDTGEIENSLFISTAAPGVETAQGALGLRYAGEASSFSVSAGPTFAKYEPVSLGTRPFTNLYQDRTWVAVQAAWGFEF